jgi:hypothetical protein
MRPKKHKATGSGDLFRARLDQIINMKHELVQLTGKVDWIDGEITPQRKRPAGIETRFIIGLLLLKHNPMRGLRGEQVSDRPRLAVRHLILSAPPYMTWPWSEDERRQFLAPASLRPPHKFLPHDGKQRPP